MSRRQLTPELPTYESARCFLRLMDGVSPDLYRAMEKTIYQHIGSPQSQTNWKDPAIWIPERLEGERRKLAQRIWDESDGLINPRHAFGHWSLCSINELFEDRRGAWRITAKGRGFLEEDPLVLREIDEYEGMLSLLGDIALSPGRSKQLLGDFRRFCLASTTSQAESTISSALSFRLKNLVARNLVERRGWTYQVTEEGLRYLGDKDASSQSAEASPTLEALIHAENAEARVKLAAYLAAMNPYDFEHVVKRLLEAMGYEDVEVTSASNDKGVDVVADITVGISQVREVVQVKRQKASIGRPTLDGLRGSLHRFDAVRASIISTGAFTKGAQEAAFERGAAPITLIDGDNLIDLLVDNDIGIRRRDIQLLEFDAGSLLPPDDNMDAV